MHHKDFWEELWAYVVSTGTILPCRLVSDIYTIGRKIGTPWDKESWTYEALCWCSRDVAKRLKKRLPESLHNRMVLGNQNKYTKDYVRKWSA